MTAVRFRDALAYGVRLYGFLLVGTIAGGAMLVLGSALVWTEFQAWMVGGATDVAAGASGAVLLFLGTSILATWYAGAAYKLLSDGTATDRGNDAASTGRSKMDGAVVESGASGQTTQGDDPAAGSTDAPAQASPKAGPKPDGATTAEAIDSPEEAREGQGEPPEPTPEEIAFGSSDASDAETTAPATEPPASEGPADETAGETADTDEGATGGSVTPAGRTAPSDPLADPLDEE